MLFRTFQNKKAVYHVMSRTALDGFPLKDLEKDRFKSVIVEKGETLINCLAYIDLNPLRAGIISRPEDYRWNSLGYHVQTDNRDNFLSTDFGLKEFNVKSKKERITRYRR
jgi:hypothetical protein